MPINWPQIGIKHRGNYMKYSKGPQNIITDEYQVIRQSEGCPWKCPWCYEHKEIGDNWKTFNLPKIVRRDIRITDMNLLAKPEALDIINQFKDIRVNNRVVYPWLVCGIDYRFLTDEIAQALKHNRFTNIHIAWDWRYTDQKKIKDAVRCLDKAGYHKISIFMICNHPVVSYKENIKKLDLCKYWGCKVNDCYFDNQISPKIIPIAWTDEQIKSFRKQVRKHNQIVNFGIDPELKP